MRALLIVPLVTVVVVALGCGDDDDGSSDGAGGTGGSGGASASSGSGGASASSGSGGQSGSGNSGGSSGSGTSGGGSGSGGMAGSAAATAGANASGGAGSGIVDGSLDPTFGVDGIALHDLGGGETFAGLTIQPSGGIVVAGVIIGTGDSKALVARFTSDGALDPSFGKMGLVMVEAGGSYSVFSKIAQQSDGGLVAVGQSGNATSDMLVARFSAEGQLDTTFGTDGFAMIDSGGDDSAAELIVLSDDTLLIGGWATPAATGTDFAVAHLDADGIPDPNFGSGGLACAHYDQKEKVLAMGRDSQGRIVG